MKTTNICNMRDIPTIQGLKNCSLPINREQIMSELVRLESEKARLDRENTIWLSNQKKTLTRIQKVQERMNLLQRVIEELMSKPQTPLGNRDYHAAQSGQETKKQSGNFREVNLEY